MVLRQFRSLRGRQAPQAGRCGRQANKAGVQEAEQVKSVGPVICLQNEPVKFLIAENVAARASTMRLNGTSTCSIRSLPRAEITDALTCSVAGSTVSIL